MRKDITITADARETRGKNAARRLRVEACEYDISRLIADEQGPDDAAGLRAVAQLDHAHAVGQVIDDPNLRIASGGDGDGLEPDRNGGPVDQAILLNAKDFESIVGGIAREEKLTVRGERERPDLTALKERIGRRGFRIRGGHEARQRGGREEQIRGKSTQRAWWGHSDLRQKGFQSPQKRRPNCGNGNW